MSDRARTLVAIALVALLACAVIVASAAMWRLVDLDRCTREAVAEGLRTRDEIAERCGKLNAEVSGVPAGRIEQPR